MKKPIAGEQKNVIHVEFFAKLDPAYFGEPEDILDRFLNFDAWSDYVEGSPSVQFYETARLGLTVEGGREVLRHFCHYWTKAPLIGKQEIREQALYREISEYDETVMSWFFYSDPAFKGGKGIKYKEGYLHLLYEEEEDFYHAYVLIDVIPTLGFPIALHLALPYVEEALVTVFKGMFEIN